MGAVRIGDFREEHISDAARLFTRRFSSLRARVPALPSGFENPDRIIPLLTRQIGRYPGAVAVRDGSLAGYLIGAVVPQFKGKRGIFVPEWANAAEPEGSDEIFGELYRALSGKWIDNGCVFHAVSVLASEDIVVSGLSLMGFGHLVIDAVCDLTGLPETRQVPGLTVRRAGTGDAETAAAFLDALSRHLASPPIFLPYIDRETESSVDEWLSDRGNALWIGYLHGEPVSCIGMEPINPTAALVVREPETVSITSGYTCPDLRGRGIAENVLSTALRWARDEGYVRCTVDFETQNIPGRRFWLSHFAPVCRSLCRTVDERILWARGTRERDSMW